MSVSNFAKNIGLYISAMRKKHKNQDKLEISESISKIPVFVINLERNKERREFAMNQLQRLGFQPIIFPAVDGKKLNIEDLEKSGIYKDSVAHEKFSRSLSLGEIGCSLSHIYLYQKMVDENIDLAIILEDDAMFVDDAGDRILELLEGLPQDWDLVQMIYECKDYSTVSPGIVRFRSKNCIPVSSAGYLINYSGAKKLLDEGYPIRYPADSYIGRSPRWSTNVYGASPLLVKINNIFPSDIYKGKTFKSLLSNLVKSAFVRIFN